MRFESHAVTWDVTIGMGFAWKTPRTQPNKFTRSQEPSPPTRYIAQYTYLGELCVYVCACVRAVAMCVVVRTHCVSYMHFFAMHTRICATQEDRECRDDHDGKKRRAELGRSMRTRTRTHACSIIVIILKRYLRRVAWPLRIAKQTRFTIHACEAYTTNNTPAPRRLARMRSVH